jgi:hypothetical protein
MRKTKASSKRHASMLSFALGCHGIYYVSLVSAFLKVHRIMSPDKGKKGRNKERK